MDAGGCTKLIDDVSTVLTALPPYFLSTRRSAAHIFCRVAVIRGEFHAPARAMQGFSGAVKVSGVSDYIAPSNACVVSLQAGPVKLQPGDLEVRRVSSRRGVA